MMATVSPQRDLRKGLRAFGILWFICLSLISLFLWIFSDEVGIDIIYAQVAFSVSLGVMSITWIFSFLMPTHLSRVIASYWIVGFGLSPIFLLTLFFGISYFFVGIENPFNRSMYLAIIIAIAMAWGWHVVSNLKACISEQGFVKKEFSVEENKIVMRTPPKTDLDAPTIRKGSMADKFGGWLFPKLIFLAMIAYPLQRLFADTGGLPAVLLLLSVLSLPLTIYIFGRMACGYYLWIHTIRKLERQHGKPVVFQNIQDSIPTK